MLHFLELKLFEYINPKFIHVETFFFFFFPASYWKWRAQPQERNIFVNLSWDLHNFTPHFILNLITFKTINKV